MRRDAILTLPNVVSLSRLALAAGFLATRAVEVRLTLVGVASASDFLDGWIARRRDAASRSGALIDPIADRVFVLAALSAFLFDGALSTGQYLLLLSRDIMTAVGFVVARSVASLRSVEFKARWLGKITTALQLATLFALLLAPSAAGWLVAAVAVVSAAAVADYTLSLWRARTA